MVKFFFLFFLATIFFLTSCSKDDVKPKASTELTGAWQGILLYEATNEPDRDKASKYVLNLIQTQSGAIAGSGKTSYTKVIISQAKDSDWRGPYPFTFRSITYDHPMLKFTLKYESGEDDDIFEGIVSEDRNSIKGNMKSVLPSSKNRELIFNRQ